MKKLIIIAAISAGLYAMYSPLSGQWVEGDKRYCKYLDGTILTVPVYQNCPVSIGGD